jgi:hypothetical protein
MHVITGGANFFAGHSYEPIHHKPHFVVPHSQRSISDYEMGELERFLLRFLRLNVVEGLISTQWASNEENNCTPDYASPQDYMATDITEDCTPKKEQLPSLQSVLNNLPSMQASNEPFWLLPLKWT